MSSRDQTIIKPPIAQKYVLLAALILSLLMFFQSNVIVDGQLRINLNRVIIFSYNYFIWAFAIPYIYGLIAPIDFPSEWKKYFFKWLGAVLIICMVQVLISNAFYYATTIGLLGNSIENPLGHFMAFFPSAYLSRIIDFTVIFFLLKGLDNYKRLNQQKIAVAALEGELTKSRLDALKMQLNPHFLFNSLHAIHSLIGYQDDKARTMVLKISNLLRRILELGNQQTVPLSEELSYLKDYLDIEEERFHDRMEVNYEIDDALLEAHVPSLILQPLAENAIKHGISPAEKQGKIDLIARESQENRFELKMTNSVSYTDEDVISTGIGLSNLKKRLEQLYGDDFSMETIATTTLFEVSIILPKRANEY